MEKISKEAFETISKSWVRLDLMDGTCPYALESVEITSTCLTYDQCMNCPRFNNDEFNLVIKTITSIENKG